jgi:GNAT superfamily N-acetyltransferase
MEGRLNDTQEDTRGGNDRYGRSAAWTVDAERTRPGDRCGDESVAVAERQPPTQRVWYPREYHWVVEIGGQVVGEAELIHEDLHSARLHRLRIDPAWQRTQALWRLIHSVHQYCYDHGRLRLQLDAGCAPRWVMTLLRRNGGHCPAPRDSRQGGDQRLQPIERNRLPTQPRFN